MMTMVRNPICHSDSTSWYDGMSDLRRSHALMVILQLFATSQAWAIAEYCGGSLPLVNPNFTTSY